MKPKTNKKPAMARRFEPCLRWALKENARDGSLWCFTTKVKGARRVLVIDASEEAVEEMELRAFQYLANDPDYGDIAHSTKGDIAGAIIWAALGINPSRTKRGA